MIASRAANPSLPRAKIVNVGSLMSLQASATSVPYTASKHALLGMTRALSVQWSEKNLCVNLLAPGWTATDVPLLSLSLASPSNKA
jgi:NAD(P)-dependent dehydrogenase (short-subunit alcohol dehydrogenase family)